MYGLLFFTEQTFKRSYKIIIRACCCSPNAGKNFDMAYVNAMEEGHKNTLDEIQTIHHSMKYL